MAVPGLKHSPQNNDFTITFPCTRPQSALEAVRRLMGYPYLNLSCRSGPYCLTLDLRLDEFYRIQCG